MFPNSSLFQTLIRCRSCFSVCWKWYMQCPVCDSEACHHSLTLPLKLGSLNQHCSKRKGFCCYRPSPNQERLITQWLEPVEGGISTWWLLPEVAINLERRNLSRRDETTCSPIFFLFQVKTSLAVRTSTRLSRWIMELNFLEFWSSLWVPPRFSWRLVIKLKSPPRTQCLSPTQLARYSRESMKIGFSLGLFGP